MDGIKKSVATVLLVLLVAACGSPTDTNPTASIGTASAAATTFTIPGDSRWQIPSGFQVISRPTRKQENETLAKDVGPPPDLPTFSMTRASEPEKGVESVTIVVFSDGVSSEAGPREVLASWTEEGIANAEYVAVVTVDRPGLKFATWRGQAQGPTQESPEGLIAAVIYDLETHKVWRLFCTVSSEETSEEVARICDQVQAEFRPL